METTDHEIAAKQQAYDEDVRLNFRWNFTANLLYGLFGTTGWRLIMAPTFVPIYMYELGGSNVLVGFLLFFGGLSRFISAPVSAPLFEHRTLLKGKAVLIGSLMRSQVLLMALGGFLLVGNANIAAFFIFFIFFHGFMGMQNVVYNTVMAKLIPVDRRGRFIGYREFAGGMMVAVVAGIAGRYLLEGISFPRNYGSMYLLAFCFTLLGLVCFAFSRESPSPVVREKTPVFKRLQSIPSQLKNDRNFSRFLLCSAVGSFALMSNPFFILYINDKLDISGTQLGLITSAYFISQTSVNLLLGRIADRRGFRFVFVISVAAWTLSMIILIFMPLSYMLAVGVYALLGGGLSGFRMSMRYIVFEFGEAADMPMRIAIGNSVSDLANSIGPLIAGFLADAYSYKFIFTLSIIFASASLVMMLFYVKEPRNLQESGLDTQ